MRATMNTISAVHSQPMPRPSGQHAEGQQHEQGAGHQHGHGQEAQVAGADEQAVEHEDDAVDRLHDGHEHEHEAGHGDHRRVAGEDVGQHAAQRGGDQAEARRRRPGPTRACAGRPGGRLASS